MPSAATASAATHRVIWPGLLAALLLAICARVLAEFAGKALFHAAKTPVSPVLLAIIFGALLRNVLGQGVRLEAGVTTAATTVLRIGIAMVGLKLTLAIVGTLGLFALPVVPACMASAWFLSRLLARPLRLSSNLSLLLAVGTAVCGCTAVMAVAPLIRANKDEMGYAVSCVVIFGVLAMLGYPWLAHAQFAALPTAAGIFLGTAIHDTSQVIGAGLIYAQQFDAPTALAAATTAKLLRNLSMVVLIPWLAWAAAKSATTTTPAPLAPSTLSLVPGFVWGFTALVVLRSIGDVAFAHSAHALDWSAGVAYASNASDFLLTMGMAAVGLGISVTSFRGIGWRPLLAAMLIALSVGIVSFGTTSWVSHWM